MDSLAAALRPPASLTLRRLEHGAVLLAGGWAALTLARLGPARAYKKVAGLLVGGLTALPGVSSLVDAALDSELQDIERELLGDGDEDALLRIPSALPAETILARAQDQHARQAGFAAGRKWGGIYHEEGPLTRLQADVWALFNCSNTLYPEVFPGTRKFEAEVVAMTVDMLHGRECGAVGLLTSGGTESILIAVLAYREQARARGNDEPEILAAVTAHPALTKACHYFGVSLTKLPVCPRTLRLLPDTVAAAISRRTVAVYASAPSFTHGVVDPIEELASLAAGRGIGLHVDNCLGGFLLSFMQRIGKHDAPFDFRVAGVTTISCDCHKFGHTSKGVSVVAFRDPALRRLSYVPSVDGCEGLYVTPTLQGSRAGATIAQAWATLLYMGEEGYRLMAEEVTQVAEQMAEIVAKIPELQLLVQPDAAIVPITTAPGAGFSIYQVASLLEAAGWNLFTGQHPPVMSACIGEQHLRVTEEWGRDLEAAVARLKAEPGIKLECSVHALAQRRLEVAVLLPAAPAVVLVELVQVAKLRLGGARGVVDATPGHDDVNITLALSLL